MKIKIKRSQLVIALSRAIDLLSPMMKNHHYRVAYIAYEIGRELGWSKQEQQDLLLAGALHDVGIIAQEDDLQRLSILEKEQLSHATKSAMLIGTCDALQHLIPLIRYHHFSWKETDKIPLCVGGNILYLADQVEQKMRQHISLAGLKDWVKAEDGKLFNPQCAEAFLSLTEKEYFWLDLNYMDLERVLEEKIESDQTMLTLEEVISFSEMLACFIDCRSRFTANHSSGVAATAEVLGRLAGLDNDNCLMLDMAGHFHDLGKIAVPRAILEKPEKLTVEEYQLIKCHTFYTYRILQSVEGLENIRNWAAYHHEKLDGTGYPFHLDGNDLDMGARIMAVADIFTALTENRPYRKALTKEVVVNVLQEMVRSQAIDEEFVDLLVSNYAFVDFVRAENQAESLRLLDHAHAFSF